MSKLPTRTDELYSNSLVPFNEMRTFLKSITNNESYIALVRLSNLRASLFIALANCLYFHFITVQDLQSIDIFNEASINKLLESVTLEQQLDVPFPEQRRARRFIFETPNADEPSTADFLGLGNELIYPYSQKRQAASFLSAAQYGRYYEVYTHTVSYYAYPSESRFVYEFQNKSLNAVLNDLQTDNLSLIFPSSGEDAFAELLDVDIRAVYARLYNYTLGKFSRYFSNLSVHELVAHSKHKMSAMSIHESVSYALINWSWPLSCSAMTLNRIVKLMEEFSQGSIVQGDSVYTETIERSKNLFYHYGISADISLLFAMATVRSKLGSDDDKKGMQLFLTYLSRFKTLLSSLSDNMDRELKVKSSLTIA